MTLKGIETVFTLAGLTGDWIAQDKADSLPADKGAYVLVLDLQKPADLRIKASELPSLPVGIYAYLGSARGPGGLRARLRRHFSSDKKIHWHVDHLTLRAHEMWALPVVGGDECKLVETLLKSPAFQVAVPRFGSTDCRRCESHLLAVTDH